MQINWKVRFKNPVWLGSFFSLLVGFIYSLLKMFDIIPTIPQESILRIIQEVLTFLGLIGVLVDPTTAGISDSNRAMTYTEPWKDTEVSGNDA